MKGDALVRDGVLALLERIESSPANGAGALLFGPLKAPDGIILTDRARICWASAVGLTGRLRQYARSGNETLGESLEGAKEILRRYDRGDEQLGRLLEEHCSEAILAMSLRPDSPAWIERSRTYDPKFSMRPTDVVGGIARLHGAAMASQGEAALRRFATEASGVALVRTADTLPQRIVAAIDGSNIGLRRLTSLAQWAESALPQSARVCPGARIALNESKTYGTSCVWRTGNILCTAWAPDGRVLASILADQRAI